MKFALSSKSKIRSNHFVPYLWETFDNGIYYRSSINCIKNNNGFLNNGKINEDREIIKTYVKVFIEYQVSIPVDKSSYF